MSTDPTSAAGPSPFQTVVSSYDDRTPPQAPPPDAQQQPAPPPPADTGSFGVGQQVNTGA